MVSWFFDHEVVIATENTRKMEVVERTKARKDPLVIVLVNSESAPAAEMFARVMIEERGTVIGECTTTAAMTGRMFGHAISTDGVVFFATMVTIGDVRMSDGSTLEKVGVVPDEIAFAGCVRPRVRTRPGSGACAVGRRRRAGRTLK